MSEKFSKAKSIKNFISSTRKRNKDLHFKNTEELEKDFQNILERINDPLLPTIFDLITNNEIKYYIENNELDYKLFKLAIKSRRDIIIS